MSGIAERWAAVDGYIEALFTPPEAAFTKALEDSAAASLPDIHISPNEGKLLYLLAKLSGAKRILEIGLLGGYSALWLSQALPSDGQLITLEIELKHAEVARKNFVRAGVSDKVEIRVGPALQGLERLVQEHAAPFDLVFIDADKCAYPAYLDWALKLTHSGSLILADNVVRDGTVAQAEKGDEAVEAIKLFNRKLAEDPRLEATLLPLLRDSLDGLALARVK